MDIVILLVLVFRVPYELMASGWLEGSAAHALLTSVCSEEVLSDILVLVSDGIGCQLVERFRCSRLASAV